MTGENQNRNLADAPAGDHTGILRLEGLVIGYRQGRKKTPLSRPLECLARPGDMIALMGRNGCGKSTLLRTIAALHEPLQGRILLEGRPLEDFPRKELSRLMGFVSTEVIRVQGLRVRDLVSMGRFPHTGWFGSLSGHDRERIRHAMGITSLEPLAERDLDELSDGERQRAMIARTLAQDTPVLVLDEPTAFLDLTHRFEIVSLLGTLAREHGKTILFSSHDLQLSLQESDKIWLMMEQGIVEGAPEDLVLSGKLEEGLLKESLAGEVAINPETGDLTIPRELKHAASLSAETEELRIWTSRSMMRTGLRVEQDKKLPLHVRADRIEGKPRWEVEKSGLRIEFNSIYDLSLYLRNNV